MYSRVEDEAADERRNHYAHRLRMKLPVVVGALCTTRLMLARSYEDIEERLTDAEKALEEWEDGGNHEEVRMSLAGAHTQALAVQSVCGLLEAEAAEIVELCNVLTSRIERKALDSARSKKKVK